LFFGEKTFEIILEGGGGKSPIRTPSPKKRTLVARLNKLSANEIEKYKSTLKVKIFEKAMHERDRKEQATDAAGSENR